jgi:hypothetical protein
LIIPVNQNPTARYRGKTGAGVAAGTFRIGRSGSVAAK